MLLLARDKCLSEMHLQQPGFTCSNCGPLTKNKKRIKKLAFNLAWLLDILKIYPEEQLLIKYYVIKYLKLLII